MQFTSIKHDATIHFSENEIEYSKDEQRHICIGKDLIGNRYKLYFYESVFNEKVLVEDAKMIHQVMDC